MFFLLRRVRRWILLSIVVPLVGLVAHKAAERIEQREGRSTKVSKGLRQVGKFTGRNTQAPAPAPSPTQSQSQLRRKP